MSSLPKLSLLADLPPLERSISDSPPSSALSSLDQPSPGYTSASTSMASFPPPYSYLPTPAASTPAYGFSSPFPSAMAYSPDLSSGAFNSFDPYNYALLSAQQQRYAANSALAYPARPTGCVSPLDLFGSASTVQSTSFGGLAGLNGLGSLGLSQTIDTPVAEIEETMNAPPDDVPSPASSIDSCMAIDGPKPVEKVVQKKKKKQQQQPQPPAVVLEVKPDPAVAEEEEEGEGDLDEMEEEGEIDPLKKGAKGDKDGKEAGTEGKKRSRTAQACERCRIRKARCFGGNPCNRCIKRKFVCEFTPTRARLLANAKPDPKPKARRHSMHTVPSASAPVPAHPLGLTQVHSHTLPHPHGAAHSHSLSQSVHLPTAYLPGHSHLLGAMKQHAQDGPSVPLVPALNTAGLSNLGLGLGLQLSPTADEDDGEGESDYDIPGMSGSYTSAASGSGSGSASASASAFGTGSGSGANSVGWSSFFSGSSELYTPLIEDEVFPFSPLESATSHMDWGYDDSSSTANTSTATVGTRGFPFRPPSPLPQVPLSGGVNGYVSSTGKTVSDAATRQALAHGGAPNDWYMGAAAS